MWFREEQRLFILLKGKKEVRGLIDFYMENAKIMKNKLQTTRI